jgi:WD40 repeat protein
MAAARASQASLAWQPSSERCQPDGSLYPNWQPSRVADNEGVRSWLASGDNVGSVRIWDPATGQQRATLTGPPFGVTAVAIAPDGTWLASAGADQTVRIWDPVTGGSSALMRVESHLVDCA